MLQQQVLTPAGPGRRLTSGCAVSQCPPRPSAPSRHTAESKQRWETTYRREGRLQEHRGFLTPAHPLLVPSKPWLRTRSATCSTREPAVRLSEIKWGDKGSSRVGNVTWQLTTRSSSSSTLLELPSLAWFSLLLCAGASLFEAQLPRLPRSFDRFVSIRRLCRMLCGCFKDTQRKSRAKSGGSYAVTRIANLPAFSSGACGPALAAGLPQSLFSGRLGTFQTSRLRGFLLGCTHLFLRQPQLTWL